MNKDIIVWEKVNVRPSDYNRHDYNCGDCTTRALTYALNFLVPIRKLKMNSIVLLKSQTKQFPIILIIIIIVIPMVFGTS